MIISDPHVMEICTHILREIVDASYHEEVKRVERLHLQLQRQNKRKKEEENNINVEILFKNEQKRIEYYNTDDEEDELIEELKNESSSDEEEKEEELERDIRNRALLALGMNK